MQLFHLLYIYLLPFSFAIFLLLYAILTARDCYEIGLKAWEESSVETVCEWMNEAEKRLENETEDASLFIDVMSHWTECVHQA